MELKLVLPDQNSISAFGSNRTFMELKLQYNLFNKEGAKCSNRTFMELKCAECDSRRSYNKF